MEPVGAGIAVASLLNGLRHGFDIDHVAAIGDITSSQTHRRGAFKLSLVYALGHATVVIALGVVAIVLGGRMPAGIQAAMPKVVGATLIALGVYVLYSVVRYRGRARIVGRWHAVGSLWRRIHHEPVVIEHAHEHTHDDLHAHEHVETSEAHATSGSVLTAQKTHRHVHQHVGVMPADPLPAYGGLATFGIGMLHGIGAETPTQVLLFATAAGVGTMLSGLGVLAAFVGGMLISNAIVAVMFLAGTRVGLRVPLVYGMFAVAIAVFSIAVGISYLTA